MELIRYTKCIKDWLTTRYQNAVICGKIPMATSEEISQKELFPDLVFINVLSNHTSNVTKPLQIKISGKV